MVKIWIFYLKEPKPMTFVMWKLFILKDYCAFIVVVLRLRYEVFILIVNYEICL